MTRRKQSQPMQRKTSADDEDAEDLGVRGQQELEVDPDETSSLHQRSESESDDEQLCCSGPSLSPATSHSLDALPPTEQREDEKPEPKTGSSCVSPGSSNEAEMSPPGIGERDELRDSSPLRLRRTENASPFNAERTESPRLDASKLTRADRHPEGAVPDNTSVQPLTTPSTVEARRSSWTETVAEERDAESQDNTEKGTTGARGSGLLTEAAHSPVTADCRRQYSAALDALKYSSPVDPLSSGLLFGSSVAKLESFVASVQADRKPPATMTSYPVAVAAASALVSPLPPVVAAAVAPAVTTGRQCAPKSSKSKSHDNKHSSRSNSKQSKSTAVSVTSAAAGSLAVTQSLDQPLDLSVKSKQQQHESHKYLSPDLSVGAGGGGLSSLANLERQFGKGAPIFDRIGTKAWAAPYCAAALRFGLAAGYPLGGGLAPPIIDPLAMHTKTPVSTASVRAKTEAEPTNTTPRSTPRRPLASPADASALLLPWAQQLSTADQKRATPAASSASTSGTTSSAGHQPVHTNFRCSCGASMESLYSLTVHLQRTGHTPAVPSVTNTSATSGSTSMDHSGSGGTSTPATGSARPPEYSKLVRGQDVWLSGGGERTRRSILRCIECGESFRSLPELTVHMVHTRHYTNIVGGTASGAAAAESTSQSSSSTSHRKSAGKSSQHHQHSTSGSSAAIAVPSASKAAPSPGGSSSQSHGESFPSSSHSAGVGTASSSASHRRLKSPPVDASTSRRRRQSSSTRLSSEHDDRSSPSSQTASSESPRDEKTTEEVSTGHHAASSLWSPMLSGGRSGGTAARHERCAGYKVAADKDDVDVEEDRRSRACSRESSESSDQRTQLSAHSPFSDKYLQPTGRKSTDSHVSSPSPGLVRPPSGPDCSSSAIKAMEFFIRSSFGAIDSSMSSAARTSSSSKRPATPTQASPNAARPASTHHQLERESSTFIPPADGLFRNRYLPPKYDAVADDEDMKPGVGFVGGKADDMQPADLTTSRRTRESDREDEEHRKWTFTVGSDKMNSDSKKCSPLTGSQAADSSTSSPADPSERSLEDMENENVDGMTSRSRSDNCGSGYRKRRNVADDYSMETPVSVPVGLKSQSELAMKRQRTNRKSSSEQEVERPTSTSSSSGRRSALESLQGLVYGQSLNSEHPLDSLQRLIYGGAAAAGLLGVEHQHLQQQQFASASSSSGAFSASMLTPQTLILVNPIVTLVSQSAGTASSITGPSLSIALQPPTAAAAALTTPTSADVTPRQNLPSGGALAGGGRGGSAGESSGSSDSAADQAVPVPPQRVYRCRACRRKFSSKGSYRYHLSRCHLLASSTSPKAASEPPGVKEGRYQPSSPASVSVAQVTDMAVTLTSAKTSAGSSTPISVQQFGCIPLDGTARLQSRYFAMDAEAK